MKTLIMASVMTVIGLQVAFGDGPGSITDPVLSPPKIQNPNDKNTDDPYHHHHSVGVNDQLTPAPRPLTNLGVRAGFHFGPRP